MSAIAGSPPYHSVSTFHAPHTQQDCFLSRTSKIHNLAFPLRLALSFLPLSLHHSSATATHQANSSLIRLTFHSYTIKKLRQYLVHTAEVIPTSSGRSSYPPSALTRGRLAHVVHLRTYGSLHAPTLHFAISQPSWLHFVFPTLAQGCFSLFGL